MANTATLAAQSDIGGRTYDPLDPIVKQEPYFFTLSFAAMIRSNGCRAYPDPDRFDIERKIDFPLMSFGQGPHFCLGNYLSRMEAKSALEPVLKRFTLLEPVSDEIE